MSAAGTVHRGELSLPVIEEVIRQNDPSEAASILYWRIFHVLLERGVLSGPHRKEDGMNPPNLWWSQEIANAMGDDPIAGLIHGDTNGLFCFHLQEWARLAGLPDDAVEIGPVAGTSFLLPAPTRSRSLAEDGAPVPHWDPPGGHDISAWREGIDIDGSLDEDVDQLEANALALLAAVRAHRQIAARSGSGA